MQLEPATRRDKIETASHETRRGTRRLETRPKILPEKLKKNFYNLNALQQIKGQKLFVKYCRIWKLQRFYLKSVRFLILFLGETKIFFWDRLSRWSHETRRDVDGLVFSRLAFYRNETISLTAIGAIRFAALYTCWMASQLFSLLNRLDIFWAGSSSIMNSWTFFVGSINDVTCKKNALKN